MSILEAMMEKKIIKKINTLQVADTDLHLKDAFLENMNDFGVKSLNIYCVVEDTDTHEESKIKIVIQGQHNFCFDEVGDEEWNEHCER